MRRYVLRVVCSLLALALSPVAAVAAPKVRCEVRTSRELAATRYDSWMEVARALDVRLRPDGPATVWASDELARAAVCPRCDRAARVWVAESDDGADEGYGVGIMALVVSGADGGLYVYEPSVFRQIGRCGIDDGAITIEADGGSDQSGAIVADILRTEGVMLEDDELGTYCMHAADHRDLLVIDKDHPDRGFRATRDRSLAKPDLMPEGPEFLTVRHDGSVVYDHCGKKRVAPALPVAVKAPE